MFFKGLLFLSGVIICTRLPVLPHFWFSFGFLPVIYLGWRYHWCRIPGLVVAGFLWTLFNAHLLLQHELLPREEGKTLYAEGMVISLPETNAKSIRFNFRIDELMDKGRPVKSNPGKVRLSWYKGHQPLQPGERWRLKIRLKRPHGFMNPGGFDYESWLFQNRLRATGYVVDDEGNTRLNKAAGYNPDFVRFVIGNKIREALPPDKLAGFIPALAIGDRSGLSDAQWRVLTATGTNHLIAISGLHIGLVAGFAYLLTLPAWGWLRISVPAIRLAAAAAMFTALVYALLAGFSLPTQRALVMVWVYFGMKLYDRRIISSDVLGIALFAVLIRDPFAPMSASFWLSFGAVAVILYGISYRVQPRRPRLQEWGRVQYIVSMGLAPALALYYQQIPIFSLFANMLAVPWVSFIVIPLILGGCLLLFIQVEWLLELALTSLQVLWWTLNLFMQWEFQLLPVARPGLMTMIIVSAGILILLLPRGITPRWLGLIWLIPLFFPHKPGLSFGEAGMTVLDVGQGLAVVVSTQKHNLLYDTGPAYASGFNTGTAVVLPYLRSSGINALDLLVQSHGDNDHIGGLKGLIGEIPISRILTSVPGRIPHQQVRDCRDGQSWYWDGVYFQVLHPAEAMNLSANDRSCVVRISARDLTLLLPGDIEKRAERSLVQRHGAGLQSDVIVAPHHGSKTSSTREFIRAVSPDIAIIPAGYRNRFNLPNQDIISRYRKHGARLLNTAESGAIRVSATEAGIQVMTHREKQRRFWHTIVLKEAGDRDGS